MSRKFLYRFFKTVTTDSFKINDEEDDLIWFFAGGFLWFRSSAGQGQACH